MSQHTPLPWMVGDEVDSGGKLVYIPIRSSRGLNISCTGVYGRKLDGTTAGAKYKDAFGTERNKPVISAEEARANARIIVCAVNCHAELLAACKLGLKVAESWIHDELDGTRHLADALAELDSVRAAIAKASN